MNKPVDHAKSRSSHAAQSPFLTRNSVQSFTGLDGEWIHCTSGRLWVTIENDPMDHLLFHAETLAIPNGGKVVISGPGSYRITQEKAIGGMAVAS